MSLIFGMHHGSQHARTGGGTAGPQHAKPWVLATAILGSSLVFIEGSVVNLALPAMQSGLDATSTQLQWVVNAYMLMLGAFMLIGGSLGDRFGMRRVFMLGGLVFCAGTGASGFAPSLPLLIAARVLQGAGGALLVPACLALISLHFPERERGRAIGIWAGASALTTSMGPLVGGGLVDAFGWHSVFLLMVPLALLAITLAWWRVPRDKSRASAAGLDYLGAGLLAAALGLCIYALVAAGSARWVAALLASISGAAFLWRETHCAAPMLPLQLFRSRSFSGANLVTLLLYGALSGGLYFLPFDLIQVQGYSALQAGAAFLPFVVIMGFGSAFAAGLMRRFEPCWVLLIGPLFTGLGFLLLGLPGVDASYVTGFLPGVLVMGLGMTVSVTPLTTVVMESLSAKQAGIASGVNNTASRLAGVLAVAGMTTLAVSLFGAALTARLQDAGLPEGLTQHLLAEAARLAESKAPAGTAPGLSASVHAAVAQAYVETFRWIMLVCAMLSAASGVIAWLSLRRSRAR